MFVKITKPPEGINENRWLDDSTTNEHHHRMQCVSSSQLKELADGVSMNYFYHKYILRDIPRYSTEAFTTGTIGHLAVLEPEKFEKSIIVSDLDQRTKEFTEWRNSLAKKVYSTPDGQFNLLNEVIDTLTKELEESTSKEQTKVIKDKIKKAKQELKLYEDSKPKNEDTKIQFTKDGGFIDSNGDERFIIKSEELNMFHAWQKQFETHKRLSVMMLDCKIEQSGVAQDPETGLWVSIRGDARNPRGYFIDPKTMEPKDGKFTRKAITDYCVNYNLKMQAAHYIETANLIEPDTYKKFFFVMMCKKPPYEIAFIQLDSDALEFGKRKRREILNQIADCESKGKWPHLDFNDNNHGIVISLPPWGLK